MSIVRTFPFLGAPFGSITHVFSRGSTAIGDGTGPPGDDDPRLAAFAAAKIVALDSLTNCTT